MPVAPSAAASGARDAAELRCGPPAVVGAGDVLMIDQIASAAHWKPIRSASQHRRAALGYNGGSFATGVHLNDAREEAAVVRVQ